MKKGQVSNQNGVAERRKSRKIPLEARNGLPAEQYPVMTAALEEDSSGHKFRTPSPHSWLSR